jgi:hypothetical protein
MRNQIKEYDHSNNMGPDVDGLIVEHEKTFQKFPIAVKVDPETSLNVNVVHHEGWRIQIVPNKIVIF